MKKFFREFRQFISKGNVLNLAVGVVLGTTFSAITTSLVNDIILPPIGLAIGGVDFKDLKVVMKEAVLDSSGNVIKQAVTWNYGNFIQTIINFLIISFCLFVMIKLVTKFNNFVERSLDKVKEINKINNHKEIARLKKEGKSRKEIKAIMKEVVAKQEKEEKEKREILEKEKAIIDQGLDQKNVMLDIRNLLIAQAKKDNLDLDNVLLDSTKEYYSLLENKKKEEEKLKDIVEEEKHK